MIGAFCLTEPGSGSDSVSMKTRAEWTGDRWVINGTKMFITGATMWWNRVLAPMARRWTAGPSAGAATVPQPPPVEAPAAGECGAGIGS